MKRHHADPRHFDLLGAFDAFAIAQGSTLADLRTQEQFMSQLSSALRQHRDNSILVHGLRVEAMFAYVAMALGNCSLITQEDSGIFFDDETSLRRPDYRVLTKDSQHFLVEVKNFHQNKARDRYSIRKDYLKSLQGYAEMMNIPLKIALFWSKWNVWTMIDAEHFDMTEKKYDISLGDALKRNELGILGDCWLATVPPLTLRIFTDPKKPRSVNGDGKCAFTIGKVALYAAGQEICDPIEQRLAWFLILYGRWVETDCPAHIINGNLEYAEHSFGTVEQETGQPFASVGFLSEMISHKYRHLTSCEADVCHLMPNCDPNALAIPIPPDYKGQYLHLWRFHQKPNLNGIGIIGRKPTCNPEL